MTELGHRYLITVNDFPLAQHGVYTLRLSIREAYSEDRWRRAAEYLIDVVHASDAETPNSAD